MGLTVSCKTAQVIRSKKLKNLIIRHKTMLILKIFLATIFHFPFLVKTVVLLSEFVFCSRMVLRP